MNKMNKDMRLVIEAVLDGTASDEQKAKLGELLAQEEGRQYYDSARVELELLKEALSRDVEVPAGLVDKIIKALDEVEPDPAPKKAEKPEGPMIVIQIKEPSGAEKIETVEKKEFTAGRGEEADVQLADEDASRVHCRFEYRDKSYHVKDLDSKNGVVLNEIKISDCDIEAGDIMRLGKSVLRIVQVTQGDVLTGTSEVAKSSELQKAYLVAKLDGEEKRFPIEKDVTAVGRGSETEVCIDEGSVQPQALLHRARFRRVPAR
ncbi:MAG: FHA domain-containing protein [Planctomycetota bacterium]|nr:FHA domain-containing protein [Planctomycetota bacterium]